MSLMVYVMINKQFAESTAANSSIYYKTHAYTSNLGQR